MTAIWVGTEPTKKVAAVQAAQQSRIAAEIPLRAAHPLAPPREGYSVGSRAAMRIQNEAATGNTWAGIGRP